MPDAPELLHGTVVAHGTCAALIRGPSGSGKSDLALRCLAHPLSSMIPGPISLVADDYVLVHQGAPDTLIAHAPEAIAGKLEVRGVGIVPVETIASANIVMIADLVAREDVDRLPEPSAYEHIQGVRVPVFKLYPFEISAAAKMLMMLVRRGKLPAQS